MPKKCIVVALDSETWELIIPWVDAGHLPYFKKLLKEESTYYTKSTMPPYTPVAWPTTFTNLSPAEHGIYDFRTLKNNQIELTDSTKYHKSTIWYRASKESKKVVVYNIPMTYPAMPVNGVMVSSFTATKVDNDFFYPSSLKKAFIKKFPNYNITAPGQYIKGDHKNNKLYAKSLLRTLDQKIAAANWFLKNQVWDVSFLGILEIDHLQHFFWSTTSKNNSPVLEGYKKIDAWLKTLSQTHKVPLVIVSDHGAGPAHGTMFPNVWLEKNGYLHYKRRLSTRIKKALRSTILRPKLVHRVVKKLNLKKIASKANKNNQNIVVRKIFLDIDDIDIKNTSAYSFGEYGGIYLTKKDNQITNKIINKLKSDFPNKITFIDTSKNIYKTSKIPPSIPDIQFLINDGGTTTTSVYAFAGHKVFDKYFSNKSGNHRPTGILAITNQGKNYLKNASLYDVAPTIADLINISHNYKSGKSKVSKNKIDHSIKI